MGWLDGLKRKAGELAARRAGKGLSMGAVGKFFLAHKKHIASGFFAVSAWAFWQDCGTVSYQGITVDILALLQKVWPALICDWVKEALQIISAFLFGLGVQDRKEWVTNFLLPKPKPVVEPARP